MAAARQVHQLCNLEEICYLPRAKGIQKAKFMEGLLPSSRRQVYRHGWKLTLLRRKRHRKGALDL